MQQEKVVTLRDVETHERVKAFIERADKNLEAFGYTEHSFRHAETVADSSRRILHTLGCPPRECELAAIAGFLHDIGNVVERTHHYHVGALLAVDILKDLKMKEEEIAEIASAIGNHDEKNGQPVNILSAAVILADKSDVHRSRVRNPDYTKFDIHDRVNYAVEQSSLEINTENNVISLRLEIDTSMSTVMEYFEIFLSRMIMCRRAADFLSSRFSLIINNVQLL